MIQRTSNISEVMIKKIVPPDFYLSQLNDKCRSKFKKLKRIVTPQKVMIKIVASY